MTKKGRFLFLGLLLVSLLFSCASTPTQEKSQENSLRHSEPILLAENRDTVISAEDEKVILPKTNLNLPIKSNVSAR